MIELLIQNIAEAYSQQSIRGTRATSGDRTWTGWQTDFNHVMTLQSGTRSKERLHTRPRHLGYSLDIFVLQATNHPP